MKYCIATETYRPSGDNSSTIEETFATAKERDLRAAEILRHLKAKGAKIRKAHASWCATWAQSKEAVIVTPYEEA